MGTSIAAKIILLVGMLSLMCVLLYATHITNETHDHSKSKASCEAKGGVFVHGKYYFIDVCLSQKKEGK